MLCWLVLVLRQLFCSVLFCSVLLRCAVMCMCMCLLQCIYPATPLTLSTPPTTPQGNFVVVGIIYLCVIAVNRQLQAEIRSSKSRMAKRRGAAADKA